MDLGHHIGIMTSLETTLRLFGSSAPVYQIFLTVPRGFSALRFYPSDIQKSSKVVQEYGFKIIVHSSYLINLCRHPHEEPHHKGVQLLIHDLNESVVLGTVGVVVHLGKNVHGLPTEQAIDNYVRGIRYALRESDCRSNIIIETGAGQGTEIRTKLEDLYKLREKFTDMEKQRIKICLDTCHMFAAGYNLGSRKYVRFLSTWIEILFGWHNIAVVHLNDSKQGLGSRRDNHADIGRGNIKLKGLLELVRICNEKKVPMVLETPGENGFGPNEQIQFIKEQLKVKK